MSVQDFDQIDSISTHVDGYVVLTIGDHLEWDEDGEHLLILQSKINSYLDFIESGQLDSEYLNAKGKKILIQIIAKFIPDENGYKFLRLTKETLQSIGHNLNVGFIKNGEITIEEIV